MKYITLSIMILVFTIYLDGQELYIGGQINKYFYSIPVFPNMERHYKARPNFDFNVSIQGKKIVASLICGRQVKTLTEINTEDIISAWTI